VAVSRWCARERAKRQQKRCRPSARAARRLPQRRNGAVGAAAARDSGRSSAVPRNARHACAAALAPVADCPAQHVVLHGSLK